MPTLQKIAILSSSPVYTEGLKVVLNEVSSAFDCFLDFESFEKFCRDQIPQVLIVDMESEGFSAKKVLAFLGLSSPDSKTIFLNRFNSAEELNELTQLGANVLLAKSCDTSELVKGVECGIQGGNYVGEDLQSLEKNDLLLELKISEREVEIIKLIAEGFINKEIADRLFLSTHTVNTHRKNIMQKLNINNTAGIVLFAVKEGIVSTDEFLFN